MNETAAIATEDLKIKPFVKWAGGKRLSAELISKYIPPTVTEITEGFAGSGALSFHLWNTRDKHNIRKFILNDINKSLILSYKAILNDPENLMRMLDFFKQAHLNYKNENQVLDREEHYNLCRKHFNKEKKFLNYDNTSSYNNLLSALFIFLNKLGYNGLYRENKRGEFNVPWGHKDGDFNLYDKENILAISKVTGFELFTGDYKNLGLKSGPENCYYFDPPYRPVSKGSFKTYDSSDFNDKSQKQLKIVCDKINSVGGTFIVSNSFSSDGFFQELYKDYQVITTKVPRAINSDGKKRGNVKELLITNSIIEA